jgi:hypothetical protein
VVWSKPKHSEEPVKTFGPGHPWITLAATDEDFPEPPPNGGRIDTLKDVDPMPPSWYFPPGWDDGMVDGEDVRGLL